MPFFTREKDSRVCTQSTRKARGQPFDEQSFPLKQSSHTGLYNDTHVSIALLPDMFRGQVSSKACWAYHTVWFLSSFEKQRRKTQAPSCSNKASVLLTALKVKAFQNSGVNTNQVSDHEIIQITGSRQDKTEVKQRIERRGDSEYCCARYLYNDKNQY